jgi:hypothetical protein
VLHRVLYTHFLDPGKCFFVVHAAPAPLFPVLSTGSSIIGLKSIDTRWKLKPEGQEGEINDDTARRIGK